MKKSSIATVMFTNRWNKATSHQVRENLLRNHINLIFTNRDLIKFLDEFTSPITDIEERFKLLKYCKKVVLQNPLQIDEEHYKAFQAEYDQELNSDIKINGAQWLEEELNFIKEVNDPDALLTHIDTCKSSNQRSKISAPVLNKSELNLCQILEFLGISKSKFYRARQDEDVPCYQIGRKIFAYKEELAVWEKSHKIQKRGVKLDFSKSR